MVLEAEPYESQKYSKGKAWEPPSDALEELTISKPTPPEKPLPDLIVYTQDPSAPPGTPKEVATRLAEMKADRERIAAMWKKEGKTKAWIPNTPEARKMKMQAKLQNRLDLKHTEVVRKFIDQTKRAIEVPADTPVVKAVDNFI